jgi:polysaccharide pyruvyl transferase WcaK-like protein
MQRVSANIALLHHTGGGNLGDQACVDAVITNIRTRWPNSAIVLLSMNPGETTKIHGIPSYPLRAYTWPLGYESASSESNVGSKLPFVSWLRTTRMPTVRLPRAIWRELAFLVGMLRIVRQFDLLVVSGGGQLNGKSGPWGFPYSLLTWCWMAKVTGARCFLLNVGAGPLKESLGRLFVKRTLSAADYVSFRDQPSQMLAQKIGFTGKSEVFPDNVYSLELPARVTGRRRKEFRRIVGVAPLAYPVKSEFCNPEEREIYDNVVATLARFASSLARHSYSLELFGTDIGEDPAVIEDLRRTLRERHDIATPSYQPLQLVNDLLLRMSAMDYVVTCRFHGVVFAHLLNKPVLAISPHPKVADHMRSLGLSQYCVDIRTVDANLLADRFEAMVRERDDIKNRMAVSLASRRSLLREQFDALFPLDMKQSRKMRRGTGGS